MRIIDHGKWIPYKPTKWPEHAPPNALFAKRERDGVDWYDYVNPTKESGRLFSENFQEDSVKIAFMFHEAESRWIIGPAVTDATMIFPANHYVREIIGFGSTDENEIIAAFRNKVIHPETSEILGDRAAFVPKRPMNGVSTLEDMVMDLKARVAKLEAERDGK
jgi:hypothetical protein